MRCSICDACAATTAAAAADAGWKFVDLQTSAGHKYRVYCPAHDVDAIVADWRATLKALGGRLVATTHVLPNLPRRAR